MVVNTAWAEDIEMADDNGLLISTDSITPSSIRKPLERLVGDDVSVQMLDIASTLGLDPDAQLTALPTGGTLGSVVGIYPLPRHRWRPDRSGAVVGGGQHPHRGGADPGLGHLPQGPLPAAACGAPRGAVSAGCRPRSTPTSTAGCYYPRFIANTTSLSNHSFGLALDLNVPGNQRGTVGDIDREVVAIFKKWGFGWGGDWRWTDPMHFELREVKRVG